MKLAAMWPDLVERNEEGFPTTHMGIVRRDEAGCAGIFTPDGMRLDPARFAEGQIIHVMLMTEPDDDFQNLLVETVQAGYNIVANDARSEPWKPISIPRLRVVGG